MDFFAIYCPFRRHSVVYSAAEKGEPPQHITIGDTNESQKWLFYSKIAWNCFHATEWCAMPELKGAAVLEGKQEWDHLESTGEICRILEEMKRESTGRTGRCSWPLPAGGN